MRFFKPPLPIGFKGLSDPFQGNFPYVSWFRLKISVCPYQSGETRSRAYKFVATIQVELCPSNWSGPVLCHDHSGPADGLDIREASLESMSFMNKREKHLSPDSSASLCPEVATKCFLTIVVHRLPGRVRDEARTSYSRCPSKPAWPDTRHRSLIYGRRACIHTLIP